MMPIIGIDLGTTFCCVSYIGEDGVPVVIPDLEGNQTTPSIIFFTGKVASFGHKAAARRVNLVNPVYQFFKRDMGKSAESLGGKYKIGGYDYQPAGMQALLLKYLRAGAISHFIKKGIIEGNGAENAALEAVITVPAYFKENQRRETRMAALAAGLKVIGIINEPTAAALTFGMSLEQDRKVLVFDLGGGTFDVTIIRTGRGKAEVIASNGADELGGKDWDELIEQHVSHEHLERYGKPVPDELLWLVQEQAVKAKIALSDASQIKLRLDLPAEVMELDLDREGASQPVFMRSPGAARKFLFENRSQDLITRCRTIMQLVLNEARLGWNDIDDIVLAGGSSRMPMIHKMLAQEANRQITLNRPGFNYDTAISIGAALYARQQDSVTDVVAHSIGIELISDTGQPFVELLLKKNTPIPQAVFEDTFEADANATLKVFEGESDKIRDYARGPLGELQLGNPEGNVKVRLAIDAGGMIEASVSYDGHTIQKVIQPYGTNINLDELTSRVQSVQLELN
ncbi:Hsp70 family protein [Rufibacter roseolus]|uniref:Hsp70 family protein n=1 Tax=Rufibacter roseolus TaxID=2817375 RepID=UPI001B31772C|nr:Hsp70 family protein [Rufibacter roseolus]